MFFKKNEITQAIRGSQAQLHTIQNELNQIGPSRLVCRKQNGHIFFTEYNNKKERGITRNKERIQLLARKEYLLAYSKILNTNINALLGFYTKYIDVTPEDIVKSIQKTHPNLPGEIILHPDKGTWSTEPYEKNPFHPEHLQYYTNGGVVVRSKSEREIGNTLEALGISYRYDVKIVCGKQIYYADFVIKRADGSIVIWEHFGREHDRVYMAKNRVRIQDYISLGYRPWDNLIWTLDSDIKNSHNIRRIIKRFILTTV